MAIKIYIDCADLVTINALAKDQRISGFTTNPSIMRAAGVVYYRTFAQSLLRAARGKPVSLEVLSDDLEGIAREARGLAALGENVLVKVPVVNSQGESTATLVAELLAEGISVNATAAFTEAQIGALCAAIANGAHLGNGYRVTRRGISRSKAEPTSGALVVSVFAGRIADAGVDPLVHVTNCRKALRGGYVRAEMLWASPRQTYDVTLAEKAGCEIITVTPALWDKMATRGKDLEEYSRETAAQFHSDAVASKFTL